MFDGIFLLVAASLRDRGYSDERIEDVLYAMKHLDVGFIFRKRRENKLCREAGCMKDPESVKAQTFVNGKKGKVINVKLKHEKGCV